jgi:Holliday junction DNA helicase RuvA
MIAYLRGKILDVDTEQLVLLAQNVGYEITCTTSTLADLQFQSSETEIAVWIYTHVREDALQLYGFASREEKQFFLSLLKVNGIGPKLAINAMSGASVDQIIAMIEQEDVKALSKLPKVGKKTAEQMILTLKGKLVMTGPSGKAVIQGPKKDATSALMNLGFRLQDVEFVLKEVPDSMSLEDMIRHGLSALSQPHLLK